MRKWIPRISLRKALIWTAIIAAFLALFSQVSSVEVFNHEGCRSVRVQTQVIRGIRRVELNFESWPLLVWDTVWPAAQQESGKLEHFEGVVHELSFHEGYREWQYTLWLP